MNRELFQVVECRRRKRPGSALVKDERRSIFDRFMLGVAFRRIALEAEVDEMDTQDIIGQEFNRRICAAQEQAFSDGKRSLLAKSPAMAKREAA